LLPTILKDMKTSIFKYVSLLAVGIAVSFGVYVASSWLILQYKLLREDNSSTDISIVIQNASNEDISRRLLNDWLSEFKKDIYVENKIEDYSIHSIKLEEEHDSYFIFSSNYSVITDNVNTAWKNGPHVEQNGRLVFDRKFWVNKVGDRYYFRTVAEAADEDFTQ